MTSWCCSSAPTHALCYANCSVVHIFALPLCSFSTSPPRQNPIAFPAASFHAPLITSKPSLQRLSFIHSIVFVPFRSVLSLRSCHSFHLALLSAPSHVIRSLPFLALPFGLSHVISFHHTSRTPRHHFINSSMHPRIHSCICLLLLFALMPCVLATGCRNLAVSFSLMLAVVCAQICYRSALRDCLVGTTEAAATQLLPLNVRGAALVRKKCGFR